MGWALKRAAAVIAVSGRLRELAVSLGSDPARTAVVPNGVDSGIFRPRDRVRLRQQLGLASGVPVVLSAGHLIELKGHHRIVEAVAEVRRRGVPARLVIAGGRGRAQDYEAEIRAAVRRAALDSAVLFTGEVSRETLAGWMCAADVFCLASSREGWPNVVHEALSCGTPVVAADVGAVPEMIVSDRYGTVVPAGRGDLLAAALADALTRSWDRDAIAAWGHSRSWEHVAEETVEQFRRAIRT
jgi:glycosyltransferase involved in cell wall biosynthesis